MRSSELHTVVEYTHVLPLAQPERPGKPALSLLDKNLELTEEKGFLSDLILLVVLFLFSFVKVPFLYYVL